MSAKEEAMQVEEEAKGDGAPTTKLLLKPVPKPDEEELKNKIEVRLLSCFLCHKALWQPSPC